MATACECAICLEPVFPVEDKYAVSCQNGHWLHTGCFRGLVNCKRFGIRCPTCRVAFSCVLCEGGPSTNIICVACLAALETLQYPPIRKILADHRPAVQRPGAFAILRQHAVLYAMFVGAWKFFDAVMEEHGARPAAEHRLASSFVVFFNFCCSLWMCCERIFEATLWNAVRNSPRALSLQAHRTRLTQIMAVHATTQRGICSFAVLRIACFALEAVYLLY